MVTLNQVTYTYSRDVSKPILNIPDWHIDAGEHVFVIGGSGSGKSTLLKLVCGLLSPDSGSITVAGESLETKTERQRDRFRATQIGYVAQSFNLIPYLSAIDNIALARSFAANAKQADKQDKIRELLSDVNLTTTHWHKPVSQLSMGQQQRVAIARAIVNTPKLLIADEPTSSLDQVNRDAFLSMLMKTAEQHNMTLVFVSHDLSLQSHFQRVDSMADINAVSVDK